MMGLIQSEEALNRTKRLSKREFLLPGGHQAGTPSFFPTFGLELKYQLSQSLKLAGRQTEPHHQLSRGSSLLTADSGT